MNNSYLAFFCLLTICLGCNSDTDDYPEYYLQIREAKLLAKENHNNDALKKFAEAIDLVDYVHTKNYIWASILAKNSGQCDISIKYLKSAINQGYENTSGMVSNEEFLDNMFDCDSARSYETLKCELLQKLDDRPKGIDYRFKQMIDSLFLIDQNIRTTGVSDQEQFLKIDSSNGYFLLEQIKTFGFPDERLVGEESAENAFILLLHFDEDVNNVLLSDLLKDALLSGKLSPSNYAWIIDRRRAWGPSKEDPFYYQMPTKKIDSLTREDIQVIDARRKEIGLKPFAEMVIERTPNGAIVVHEDWTDL